MDHDLISSYVGLLSLATLAIYAGSFGSLPVCARSMTDRPCTYTMSLQTMKRKDSKKTDDDSDEETEDMPERLTSEGALDLFSVGQVAHLHCKMLGCFLWYLCKPNVINPLLNVMKIGSATLLGLYIVIKYLGSHWLNKLLGWYFAATGIGSVWKVSIAYVVDVISRSSRSKQSSIAFTKLVCGPERWRKFDRVKLRLEKGTNGTCSSHRKL